MRKTLSKKEIKELNGLVSQFNIVFSKKDSVVVEDEKFFRNDELVLFKINDVIIPSLKLQLESITLPRVVVDMGAIKFVIKGANIMRPGIVSFDDFEKNSFVVIVDQNFGKPIAIGKASYSSGDLENLEGVVVFENVHYVGDKLWNS